MSYSNGKLPSQTTNNTQRGLPGVGFSLTDDGNYDIQGKKLTNVGTPEADNDASTKGFVSTNYLKLDGTNMMTGDVNMNSHQVKYLSPPTDNDDATTKYYVDQNDTNIRGDINNINSQIPDFLRRDGSVIMTANLDMGSQVITRHGIGTQPTDLVNRSYIDTELSAKSNIGDTMLLDGTQSMNGNINMGLHRAINAGQPINPNDVSTKNYCDTQLSSKLNTSGGSMTGNLDMGNHNISNVSVDGYMTESEVHTLIGESHIHPSDMTNKFSYLMEQAIYTTTDSTYSGVNFQIISKDVGTHRINKSVWDFQMKRSLVGNDNVHNVQFSIVLPSNKVPIGKYTLVIEFYCDNVDDNTDIILSTSGINIDLQHSVRFSNYIKKRVVFQKEQDLIGNASPRIFITFQYHLDGSPTSQNLFQNANAVVYGVEGFASNLPSTVYDPLVDVENGHTTFNTNVDFKNHFLHNVSDPQVVSDGCHKRYVDNQIQTLTTTVNNLDIVVSNLLSWALTQGYT